MERSTALFNPIRTTKLRNVPAEKAAPYWPYCEGLSQRASAANIKYDSPAAETFTRSAEIPCLTSEFSPKRRPRLYKRETFEPDPWLSDARTPSELCSKSREAAEFDFTTNASQALHLDDVDFAHPGHPMST